MMSEWIPCKDRLPEKDGRYLVSYHVFDDVYLVSIEFFALNMHEVDEYFNEVPGWYNYDEVYGYYEKVEVNAWMLLPEHYKEK